jgi:hypothetical protein
MHKKQLILALLAGVALSGAAQAALHDRGSGLIYDDVLNLTWLQDANYAKTRGYDADGLMNWSTATTWADTLVYHDSVRNVDYSDWRLPTMIDTGTSGCNFAYSGTDCGYNVDTATSEMANLYFVSLGNQSYYTTTGANSGAYDGGANPNSTLDNVGPFINLQSYVYWSGLEFAPNTGSAWFFYTFNGYQYANYKDYDFYAWAVRPGDVVAVPEADTWAMLLAGLGLVGVAARRRRG